MTVEFAALVVFVSFASWSAQAAPVSAGAILTVKEHIIPAGSLILPNIFHAQPAVHLSGASESNSELTSLSSAGSAPRSDPTVATETADILHIPSPIPQSDAPDAGTGSFLRPRLHPYPRSSDSQADGIQPSSDADADKLSDYAVEAGIARPDPGWYMGTGWKRSIAAIACVGDCEDRSAEFERDELEADGIYSSCDTKDVTVSRDTAGWYMGQRCTPSVSVDGQRAPLHAYRPIRRLVSPSPRTTTSSAHPLAVHGPRRTPRRSEYAPES
ncbi:hypothetical protein K466DRAFT_602335 [Polyporus arcularius HHB13444]|uniref:Uncharacterized protein n=1 Tax=Polyporus arcularius HHB13444 TaxID=1314778 RepID=A0A5C3P3L8_9APHY|nr:hypothetical protein K466DRAFT_602335 [Polyporus arcularius HHB13444]